MNERVLKIQERSRNGIRFFSIMSRSGCCKKLLEIKKKRDSSLIDSDPLIQAIIRYVATFAIRGKYQVITVPPASKAGVCWAGDIAERIARISGLPFCQFFEPHNQGKRFYLAAKFKPIEFRWTVECTWQRVLVFDDFSLTNITITNTIREIRKKAVCDGIVMCV
jgi:hypothetical protein